MSKLVDKFTRIAAMQMLKEHFLSQPYRGGNTPSEKAMRHEAVAAELESYGDRFDAHDVMWLFSLLESRAFAELNKFAALAQTTDPDAMLKHGVPRELVDNAKLLKEHHGMQAKAASVHKARASKPDAKAKMAFQKWVKKTIDPNKHSGKIQIEDVRGMEGFETSWGQTDTTLKLWLREMFDNFSFKRGARKK
jgi:hypothetical protein